MMTHDTQKDVQRKQFFTVPELADYLRVSTQTIYRYVEKREIGFVSLPRGLRFAIPDVEAFLVSRKVSCVNEHMYERTKDTK